MADIFKEVDEALRREKAEKYWKRYGTHTIALAVAVVLAVAGVQAWRAYERGQRAEVSDRFAAARLLVESGDSAAGRDAFAALSDPAGGGYGGLAAFREAALRASTGDTAAAIAIWDRITADSDLGPGFRDAATILSVMHQADNGDPAVLKARLQRLTQPGQAFRASALELSALLALRAGDRAEARTLYATLADDRDAPRGLRERAAQMLAALPD